MDFTIDILGANSANFAYGRHQTSQLLSIHQRLFLVDCGEATQLQLQRYRVRTNRIDHVFISHLHGDHYLGLIGLLSTLHLQGRKHELWLYGPAGLAEILTVQFRHSNTQLQYAIHFQATDPTQPQILLEDDTLTVRSFPLSHRVPCCGFSFNEKPRKHKIRKEKLPGGLRPEQLAALKQGEDLYDAEGQLLYRNADLTVPPPRARRYAFCSDTRYDEGLLPHIADVDVLYHEATFTEALRDRAHATYHSTAAEAARIAQQARVGRLLIGHYSSRYRDLTPLLDEARTLFAETYLALEGERTTIEP